jgi:transposase
MDKVSAANVATKSARRTSPQRVASARAPRQTVTPAPRHYTAWEVKLQPSPAQQRTLERHLRQLQGVWNWAIRRYQWHLDNRSFSEYSLDYELIGHAEKCGLSRSELIGICRRAYLAWKKFLEQKPIAGKKPRPPRLKGRKNRLSSFDVPLDFRVYADERRMRLPRIGRVRFKGPLPEDAMKYRKLTVSKTALGWYCTVVCEIPALPKVEHGSERLGVDPGYTTWLTLSDGSSYDIDREREREELRRIGQAQRGGKKRLAARIKQRTANRRAHAAKCVAKQIVSRAEFIAWSDDNVRGLFRMFGKSAGFAAHAQVRGAIERRARLGSVPFLRVPSHHSTRTCSACGSLSGPTGYAGLKVRQWVCRDCGVANERDVNAARNSLLLGESLASKMLKAPVLGSANMASDVGRGCHV